jgi:endonuclease/exonuclease/phosphatase family metal-dependent hydrolase
VSVQPTTLKFATWNIGGGILGESHQRGADSSLDYYVSVLCEQSPDVVCLQEAHSFEGRLSQCAYLARRAGYRYFVERPISESHLAKGADLTLGILSRYEIRTHEYQQFPNPGLTAIGPNGDQWELFDKGYVKAVIDVGKQPLGVLNAHCFPLHYFRAKPTESRFRELWQMLAEDLRDMHGRAPTIAGMDLNYEPVQDLLTDLLQPGGFSNAFGSTPTTAKGVQQDYILYDQRMELVQTTVRPTRSDHSYCQVEIMVGSPGPSRESPQGESMRDPAFSGRGSRN